MSEYKGIMVLGEIIAGKLSATTAELLGPGRRLADKLGQELAAVLVGSKVSHFAQEAITLGADKVYIVDDPLLKDYQIDCYLSAIEKVVKQAMPQIILMEQSAIGRDLAPRLAFRLGTAAITDCVALAIDPDSKRLLAIKPVYGGKAQATFSYETDPQIATVKAQVIAPLAPDSTRQGVVITIKARLDPSTIKTKVLEKVKEEIKGIKLEEASVVVGGGRGMGGADGFQQLEELAKLLKGAVGASRPACAGGWVPDTTQIGLTGKIITPDLYIAIGISGASQHTVGCSGAKTIVAINQDAEANIFKVAHFGVIGDWQKVLPAFTKKVKELLDG